jgi:hypothetical protein
VKHRERFATSFLILLALTGLLVAPLAAFAGEKKDGWTGPGATDPGELAAAEEALDSPSANPAEILYHPLEGFSLKYGKYKLGIHALVHLDGMVYEPEDYDPSSGTNHRSNTFTLRRAFIGLTGKAGSWLDWIIEYDVPNYSMRDTYAQISAADAPLKLRAGYFKPAVLWEEFGNPDGFLTFNERSADVLSMSPGRRLGVMAGVEIPGAKGKPPLVRLWGGVHNGWTGWRENEDNNWGLSAMVEWNVAPSDGVLLQAGVSQWLSYVHEGDAWEGLTPDGLTYFFPNYDMGGLEQMYSAHANAYLGPVAVMGQYTLGIQQRKLWTFVGPGLGWENLAPVIALGMRVDVCLMIWSPDGKPRRDPRYNKGLEACVRVERLQLDDAGRGSARRSSVSFASDADNPLGGQMTAATLGLNWHITERIRLSAHMQAQYFNIEADVELRPNYDDDDRYRRGGPRCVFLFRLQIMV